LKFAKPKVATPCSRHEPLRFKGKGVPPAQPAPVLRFRPKHVAGVPDAARPFLDALAQMIADDVVREYRRPKLRLKFKAPQFPA
jgi:hypothetical protein